MQRKSLFALQIFFPLEPGDTLRGDLHQAIRVSPSTASFAQKRRFYDQLVARLLPEADRFVRGTWDYTDSTGEAEREFAKWCSGIPSDAQQRREAAEARALQGDAGQRYGFVTLVFVFLRGESADERFERLAMLPPDRLWRRETFRRFLAGLRQLDFTAVHSDALFVCPGADELGFTEEELRSERYAHLHAVE